MPRVMTTAVATALCAPVIRPALLVSMVFANETAYAWSGVNPFTWGGMTFQGVGDLGMISAMSEDSNVEARGVTLSLTGIPSHMVTEILSDVRVLGDVKIWLAVFDATGALIPNPILCYQGKMDAPALSDGGDTCTAQISIENVLVDLNRPVYRRYTNEDQQGDHPGDTAMQYVAGLQEQITFWGKSPSSVNNV